MYLPNTVPQWETTHAGSDSVSHRARQGFSLMELLVVMAVLALLSAILLPVFARVRERAHQMTCLSHLRQIGQARLMYVRDSDGWFSEWWQLGSKRPEPFGLLRFWPEILQPYLRDAMILRDPSAGRKGPPEEWLADYALLTWGPGGRGTREKPYYRWPGPRLCMSQVARPSETAHLTDGTTSVRRAAVEFRHNGGINVGFLDGHVRWMTAHELARPATDGHGFYWRRYQTADR